MDNNIKESFVLYASHRELVEQLSNEQAGKLFKAIFEYTSGNNSIELDSMTRMAFISIRQDLDRNAEKYEAKRKKLSENGAKGGRPPKQKTEKEKANGFSENQMFFLESKKSLDDDVNADDYVNILSHNVEKITENEREILINYIDKNCNATNRDAYLNTMLQNGSYKNILAEEASKLKKKQQEQQETVNTYQNDKLRVKSNITAAQFCCKYWKHDGSDQLKDVSEIQEKYKLPLTYSGIERFLYENNRKLKMVC